MKVWIGGLAAIVILAILTHLAGLILGWSPQWYQNYAPKQPIPFSHKRHAGDFKIPCVYCHGAAEYTAHAEVPGLETCMNCHQAVKIDSPWIKQVKEHFDKNQPIQWVKVHVLPDFVHFNHKRHIGAGVECATCHGPVETMDQVYQYSGLHMGWCINCHRNNNYVREDRVKFANLKEQMLGNPKAPEWFEALSHSSVHNADTSCSTCHY